MEHTFIMTSDVRNFWLIPDLIAKMCSLVFFVGLCMHFNHDNFCSCYARQSGAWAYTIARLAALEAEDRLIHA